MTYHRATPARLERARPSVGRGSLAKDREAGRLRRTSTVIGLVLLVVFGTGTIREVQRRAKVHRELEQLQVQITSLEHGNVELEQLLSYLASDSYVEAEAKRSLGLGWRGEQPVVVGEAERVQPAATAERSVARPGAARLWWNYFFSENS